MFEFFIAGGTIDDKGMTVERLKFVGNRRNEFDDEDVVDAGEIGVNVNDDIDDVEFVGLGQILGEFGGGNKSLSGC